MLCGQWKYGRVRVWFRHELKGWCWGWSERGGWQGERTAQIAFVLELERLLQGTKLNGIVDRIGVADDFYFVGKLADLTVHWPEFE